MHKGVVFYKAPFINIFYQRQEKSGIMFLFSG